MEDKVIMEESYSLIKELKDLKNEHRTKIEKMKSAKTQIYSLEINIKNVPHPKYLNPLQCKKTLVDNFEVHLKTRYQLDLEDKLEEMNSEQEDKSVSQTSSQQDPEITAYMRARQRVLFSPLL